MKQTRTISLDKHDLHAAVLKWLEDDMDITLDTGDVLTTNMDDSVIPLVVTIESPAPVPEEASCDLA